MVTRQQAHVFAHSWVDAWNSRDLERIVAHYAADAVVSSPFAASIVGEPSGTVRGKVAIRAYYAAALAAFPDLHFVVQGVTAGAASVAIRYRSVLDVAAIEVFEFDGEGKIARATAHYSETDIDLARKSHRERGAWLWASGVTPILNVSSIPESIAWFQRLGFAKCWDWGTPPTFGSVGAGEIEIFLCLNAQGGRGKSTLSRTGGDNGSDDQEKGVWMSLWVESVDAVHARCMNEGIEVTHGPADEPWGVREMHVRHPDGHVLRISQSRCC